MTGARVCPECGHEFKGNGWDGVDAHWKAKHEHVMSYREAWPLLRDGVYVPLQRKRSDPSMAAPLGSADHD
jgi:transposase